MMNFSSLQITLIVPYKLWPEMTGLRLVQGMISYLLELAMTMSMESAEKTHLSEA